jgi:hypothetical protein
MGNPEAEKILQRTRQTLQVVEAGLEDLAGDKPARSIAGLQSVAVLGRAVTNVACVTPYSPPHLPAIS